MVILSPRWVFWSEGYDIKFKVSFRVNNSVEPETLKPLKRIECHLVPEDGILECLNTGTCMYQLIDLFDTKI